MKPEELTAVVHFHGHFCPGLAIGIRASELALREINPLATDEEMVAIVETDMCGVDAIQFLTGCTFGKGNLIHLDYGKNAFTFIRRSDGKAIRLVLQPQSWGNSDSEFHDLNDRIRKGESSQQDSERLQNLLIQRGHAILRLPYETLFKIQPIKQPIPEKARVRESIQCEACGEMVMETRLRLLRGQKLCIPCFNAGNL